MSNGVIEYDGFYTSIYYTGGNCPFEASSSGSIQLLILINWNQLISILMGISFIDMDQQTNEPLSLSLQP